MEMAMRFKHLVRINAALASVHKLAENLPATVETLPSADMSIVDIDFLMAGLQNLRDRITEAK